MMQYKKVGNMNMTAAGIARFADAMSTIYGEETLICMPVWNNPNILLSGDPEMILQLSATSGKIDLVKRT